MQKQVQLLTVTEDEDGQRLDNYLLTRLKGVPKSAVYRIVRKGEVRVNKGRARPERRLCCGDVVRVPPVVMRDQQAPAAPSLQLAELLERSVLYDDGELLVVNKPSGIAVHGGSGINLGLIEALRQMPRFKGFLELVHRLDKETSGCVMIARKRRVLKYLQDQLRAREGVQKTYVALLQGEWPRFTSEVDVPLKRFVLPNGERIVRVNKEGKPSLTRFEVDRRFGGGEAPSVTLVKASPITGRTHQIRVHAGYMGCPLVGDMKYGDTPVNQQLGSLGSSRLFLHAQRLEVDLESGQHQVFEAPLPKELQALLERLESREVG